MTWTTTVRRREIAPSRREEFVAKGHRLREVFPHSIYVLPRPGPDGAQLASAMCGANGGAMRWQIILMADSSLTAEFPDELFFDKDVVWHQQHLGRPGQIASVDVVQDGPRMWTMAHQSDLVQRIGRRREYKTRIEQRFGGWHAMALNAVMSFAVERSVKEVHTPTARFALKHTDRSRNVGGELFERVYDRAVLRLLAATQDGDWWKIDVGANRRRVVVPEPHSEVLRHERTICLCHDVEAGLGHVGIDDRLARKADASWRANLTRMLEIERKAGVRGTYNVVGALLPEVRDQIESDGHCVGFHSYDHRIPGQQSRRGLLAGVLRRGKESAEVEAPVDQLARCRQVDYRIKGYRPPQSRITPELSDDRLLWHNFEWLASSPGSLGANEPVLRHGIVRIPIREDDFPLYRRRMRFRGWEKRIGGLIADHDVTAFSVHDCYAHLWLDRYSGLLDRLSGLGAWRTLDEVAGEAALAAAV